MKGENIIEEETISLIEAKKFLVKIHIVLKAFLEKHDMLENYEMYPAEDVVYIMFREYFNSKECLRLFTIAHGFELSDLAKYNSVEWWFLSSLAFDADFDKVKSIIERKITKEEKSQIGSIIESSEGKIIRKRI
ncbi:hypothetical protein ABIC12_004624 [Pantoea agglomerans]|jgi:hypothetical protein|uniref:hypothetical protein n=1 Tax=Enterobacter agglomerans TaxID=549 RepID=UPI003395936E